jgi:S1-C subfamily serine protease
MVAFLAVPLLALAGMTTVNIDGTPYVDIQDAHVVSGGRIVLLYGDSGTTVSADKLPRDFLESWNITPAKIAASKAASEKQAEQSLAQAVRAGLFREVDGVVYDLRKPQPGWRQFSDARILAVNDDGALVQPEAIQAVPQRVFVRDLPHIFGENQRASFMAKLTGDYTFLAYVNKDDKNTVRKTVQAYDVGRVCERNEIPNLIIQDGEASASLGYSENHMERVAPEIVPVAPGVRAIGSGFFIAKEGYLLTNFHVVKGAKKIEVKYGLRTLEAAVVRTDEADDLAVVKVLGGGDFSVLPISRKESVDLGDEVFTIGFPNIGMQGLEPKYTDGRISSLAGMQDDPTEYQISVPVQPGNSGGPLCDTDGTVVGIIVARLNDMATLRESGAVPQNVNYAVKSKFALKMLRYVDGIEDLPKPGPAPVKPIKTVEDAIAMLEIY